MTAPELDYEETLRVPASWWLLGALCTVGVWWVLFVTVTWEVSLVAALVTATMVGTGLWRYGSVRVVVDAGGLHVERALLPHRYVGAVTALDESEGRAAAGVDADARAFLVLRGYCRGAVKVDVNDDGDPAPYWLVSTRRPGDLSGCLTARSVQD